MKYDNTFFENILNAIGYSICVYDMNGIVAYYNTEFKDIYLKNDTDFYGRHYSEIENPEYKEVSCIFSALKNDKGISVQKRYGQNKMFSVSVTPFIGADGNMYMVESIIRPSKASLIPIKADNLDTPAKDMILSDKKMKTILETINRISNFDSTVLITGESGTGKTMLARYIHAKSKRANAPFVTINCATIPENLIESELFGYVSGAFTGASQKGKAGMVELANKGTLFLDEIGLLPLNLQAKFLQLVQEKTYLPVGAVKSKTVDVRIVSATNLNLETYMAEKKFREDLYYRLRVIEFYMPPLRERMDAIEPLIEYFLSLYNKKYSIEKTISTKATDLLKQHRWSGNIRELQYVIEKLFVTSADSQITSEDIPPINDEIDLKSNDPDIMETSFDESVEQYERKILGQAFSKYKSSYKVATVLGMTQSKASRLLRKYNIK